MTTNPATATALLLLLLFLTLHCSWLLAADTDGSGGGGGGGGTWELLLNSSGVVAMHMTLTHLNTVIFYDQTSSGPTGYLLNPGRSCSSSGRGVGGSADDQDEGNGTGSFSHVDRCWAHSMQYDVATNSLRPLTLRSDTWCSSGSFLRNGTLQQTGGYGSGGRRIRYLRPCADFSCDWTESPALLAENRWYATSQILPGGEEADGGGDRVFILGGLDAFTYEFVPKSHSDEGAYDLPFLRQTRDAREKGNNLYPFIHLSSDGNLFIFANRDSILFDYRRQIVTRTFPRLPGAGARNYPSTGSSVILPLDHTNGFRHVEVMICGGAAAGAYQATLRNHFRQALSSCGRMVITDDEPEWAMENMPGPRLMSDMLVLPTGDALIINGATHGCAGWQRAINPVLTPYLYNPKGNPGERFSVLRSSSIPRLYHSTALLLADGRILVGGSNPYYRYNFSGYPYPTELRIEAFTPYYLSELFDDRRATNVRVEGRADNIRYGEDFAVTFEMERRPSAAVEFVASAAPFVTHSLSMHQRVLRLECRGMEMLVEGYVSAVVRAPPSPVVAPAGYYMFTVVHSGIPSKSLWVRFIG